MAPVSYVERRADMRRMIFTFVAAALAASLTACTVQDSTGVATSSIKPWIYVESNPSSGSTFVAVALLYGFNHSLQLATGDTITVAVNGGPPTTMSFRDAVYLKPAYKASLSGVGPGDRLVIALNRATEVNAPNTIVTIPAAFNLTGPSDGDHYLYSEPIVATWPAGSSDARVAVRIEVQSCSDVTSSDTDAFNTLVDYPRLTAASDGTMMVEPGLTSSAGTCTVRVFAGEDPGAISPDPAFGEIHRDSAAVRLATPLTVTFSP